MDGILSGSAQRIEYPKIQCTYSPSVQRTGQERDEINTKINSKINKKLNPFFWKFISTSFIEKLDSVIYIK